MEYTFVNSTCNYRNNINKLIQYYTISVQVLPIKKKWNEIKLKKKIIGSLRYHDGDGYKKVA